MKISIAVGAMAATVEAQLACFNFEVTHAEAYQKDLDAVTRLLLRGSIPKSVADKARNKVVKEVFKNMKAKEQKQ